MFSGRAVKICMLISCLSTAAVLGVQTLPAQNLPRPASDRTLDQCEKELARDKELVASGFEKIASGFDKARTVLEVSHKVYELSNTFEQKDVEKILKEHGLRDRKTIRTFMLRIKSLVTKNFARGTSSLFVGIIVGGVLEPNGRARASTSVGQQDSVSPPRHIPDEDFGPLEDGRAPHPTDEATVAPMVQRGESEKRGRDEFELKSKAGRYEGAAREDFALRRCERYSPVPVCILVWCRPGS
jgi:hypothetical protein